MRNACPTCQTVYAVTPADVGRKIVCTRCNANLVIDADGFRLADGTGGSKAATPKSEEKKLPRKKADDDTDAGKMAAGEEDTVDASEARKARRKRGEDEEDDDDDEPRADPLALFKKYVDIPTGVFTVGVVIVLWFLFAPIIGAASVKWYAARIDEEQLSHDAEVLRLKEKNSPDIPKFEEEWRKRKDKLENDSRQAGIGVRTAEYWHRLGTLAGFIVTAVGSVGLLMTHQHTTKKIVGAVVVCAMMILVFVTFVGRG